MDMDIDSIKRRDEEIMSMYMDPDVDVKKNYEQGGFNDTWELIACLESDDDGPSGGNYTPPFSKDSETEKSEEEENKGSEKDKSQESEENDNQDSEEDEPKLNKLLAFFLRFLDEEEEEEKEKKSRKKADDQNKRKRKQ